MLNQLIRYKPHTILAKLPPIRYKPNSPTIALDKTHLRILQALETLLISPNRTKLSLLLLRTYPLRALGNVISIYFQYFLFRVLKLL